MKIPANSPTRARTIQGAVYAAVGMEDFQFQIPSPFTAASADSLATEYGCDATGVATSLNQTLAENMGNNMAARIRNIAKHNDTCEEGDEKDLPDQSDMDKLVEAYDFSGSHATGSSAVSLSPFQKIMLRLSRQVIRNILKASGYRELPAPVTIAKKGNEPTDAQVSYEAFEEEVRELVEGESIWSEDFEAGGNEAFVAKRAELIEAAKAEEAANAAASIGTALKIGS